MKEKYFKLESFKLFSESHIWQLNRDYYQQTGIDAWSSGVVPHHLTSNSMVGKTYAELILGLLKDLAIQGETQETVYILELGAGHGRLAFHILKHLQKLISLLDIQLPPFCYILSDIVEDNLLFFKNHPQLQTYYEQGILDFTYFDAISSNEIHIKYKNKIIKSNDLNQPIVAIANYFFDSLPNDLFLVQDKEISICSISLDSTKDPKEVDSETLLNNLHLEYKKTLVEKPYYKNIISNEILDDYKNSNLETHIFFPQKGLQCLNNLIEFSDKGLMLLSMDKGYHLKHNLNHKKEPEIITHGSFSLWVNFHAYGEFCEKKGGKKFFPDSSTFHLQIACFLFLEKSDSYQFTNAAYQRFVNDFGPDDFNSIKKSTYKNIEELNMIELLALLRLSAYDSSFFIKIFPRIKKLSQAISIEQRIRLAQAIHKTWNMYFDINEPYDFANDLAGLFYELGFFQEALDYFDFSIISNGKKDDTYYNMILCYYQLRKDELFVKTLKEAKGLFPDSTILSQLDKLDLDAS